MDASAPVDFDIVIPTRNRCPYPPDGDLAVRNPLVWTLETIAADAGAPVRSVIVVDDASTDHTAAVLRAMSVLRPWLRLSHIRLSSHHGSAAARNCGVRLASSEWLLFTDDDCLFGRHGIRRAAELVAHLRRRDPRLAALNLPYYLRRRTPARVVPVSAIGEFDPWRGRVSGNFDTLPDRPGGAAVGSERLACPIPVRNLGCTFAAGRRSFLAAGGFPQDFHWKNSYGEETELAARMTEAGGTLYYAPDPRCHVVHMKYGAEMPPGPEEDGASRFTILGKACTLAELSAWSNQPQAGSGNRVAPGYAVYSRILSYFCIMGSRSVWGACRWLWHSYRDVVHAPSGAAAAGLSRTERAAIWRSAAWRGFRRAFRLRLATLPLHHERRP